MDTTTAAPKAAPATPATVSLASLDLTAKCEQEFTFPVLDSEGKETGITLTVLGSKAPRVMDWLRKTLNRRRSQEAMQAKRGKEIERTIEDDEEFGAEAAAIRITGWTGITEDFTHARAVHLVTINEDIRDQVFAASNDLTNFTKG